MKSCWNRNNTQTNTVKDLSWFYFVVVVVALTASTQIYCWPMVLRRCHFRWQKSMFRSFLTQRRLDQDPKKTVQSNDLSQYSRLEYIKSLCIAGWSEQGGVEEGEASPVHDPQVLQGEILYFNNISECITYDKYDIRMFCKMNRSYFNNISECIKFNIWYDDLQVHIFPLFQSLHSTYSPLFELISQACPRIPKYSTAKLY